jgi:hypothetical protein
MLAKTRLSAKWQWWRRRGNGHPEILADDGGDRRC